eukprot:11183227-Lingulodinium_polyedra.AAC.3
MLARQRQPLEGERLPHIRRPLEARGSAPDNAPALLRLQTERMIRITRLGLPPSIHRLFQLSMDELMRRGAVPPIAVRELLPQVILRGTDEQSSACEKREDDPQRESLASARVVRHHQLAPAPTPLIVESA